ncbi:MAG: GNAT family N-acetyltransferase [Chloroflexota bacterium]
MGGTEADLTQSDRPVISIAGEQVALGPTTPELLPLVLRWRSDFEVTRTLAARWRLTSRHAVETWYDAFRQHDHGFMIYERETLRPIGFATLMDIDHLMRTAELALVIGEKDYWGKGYGTEATTLMLDYAFTWIHLHSVKLRVFAHNERGLRAYQRAGFKLIGRWREAYRIGDRALDVIFMDCLATEFRSPVLRRFLPDE